MNSLLLDIGDTISAFSIIIPIISGLIFVFVFITIIVAIVKHVKGASKITNTIEDSIVDNFNRLKEEAEEKKNPYVTCDYCGSTNDKTSRSCVSCGASLKINKKK